MSGGDVVWVLLLWGGLSFAVVVCLVVDVWRSASARIDADVAYLRGVDEERAA